MLGTTLQGRYKLTQQLSSGGLDVTFLAEDQHSSRNPVCVVKQLKPKQTDPLTLQTARHLFESEAAILSRLGEHHQIPRLLAHFEENQEFYLVQEFIPGHTLEPELQAGQPWSQAEVLAFLRDLLQTLSYIHRQGVIHRDLNPTSLIRRQTDQKIVVTDFGAIKAITTQVVLVDEQAVFSFGVGTPGYMPAEQANGTPTLSSDVYSAGMIALQALTGRAPQEIPQDPMTGEILWLSDQISPDLAAILDKMVRYDSQQRYPSATEALAAIEALPAPVVISVANAEFEAAFNKAIEALSAPVTISVKPTRRKVLQFAALAIIGVGISVQVDRFRRKPSAPHQSFTQDLGNGVSLKMVLIPGGTFLMGSPESEDERERWEGPQHQVTVPAFFMGKFEVTQQQYQAVMGNNPSRFKGDNRPVEKVSWDDAVAFCQSLSDNETSKQNGRTYRLPTEAEWEYACRAGTKTPFYFGEMIHTDWANYYGNSVYGASKKGIARQQTTEVEMFKAHANAFGLCDMHGNVSEWCADDWHSSYTDKPENLKQNGSLIWLSSDEAEKLLRGGSLGLYPRSCRSAHRNRYGHDERYNFNIGFRLVVSVSRTL